MKKLLPIYLITSLALLSLAFSTPHSNAENSTIAVIQGYVYDSATSLGLEGVLVSAADIYVTTDTAGFYFLEIEPGNYDLFYIKQGWYTHIIPGLAVADTMNIDIVLLHSFVDFPFEEDWASGDFETNGWTILPAQGNWSIDSSIGNPAPSAWFSWNPVQTEYSFELYSMEIDTRLVSNEVWFQFDYQLINFTPTGTEKLKVDIWDGQEWIQLDEFANTQHIPWTRKSIDVTAYASGQFTRVRFVAHGYNSQRIRYWRIDNISISHLPEISVQPSMVVVAPSINYISTMPFHIFNNGNGTLNYNAMIQIVSKSDEKAITAGSKDGLSVSSEPLFGGEPEPSTQNNAVVLHYDGPNFEAIGLTAGGTFSVAARFPATMVNQYSGLNISDVDVFIHSVPLLATLKIWGSGTDFSPGALLYQQDFVPYGWSWNKILLNNTVVLDGMDIWVGYTVTHAPGVYIAGVDAGPANPNGDWISIDGTVWEHLAGYGLNYNWNIRASLTGQSWLSIDPTSGSIAPGGSKTHTLIFNTIGMDYGSYQAKIRIYSNDPSQPLLIVNVYMDLINNVDEPEAYQGIIVYPVPATNELYFNFFHEFASLSIWDLAGSVLLRQDIRNKTELLMDTSKLPGGLYILQSEAKDGRVYSRKIVICR